MNPLLNDSERGVCAAAGAVADELITPLLEQVEATGALPDGLPDRLAHELLAPVDGEASSMLAVALRLEEMARRSAGASVAGAGRAVAGWLRRQAGSEPVTGEVLVGPGFVSAASDDGAALTGRAELVAGAADAAALLVVAGDGAESALYEVAADAAGVTRIATTETLGLRGSGTATVAADGARAHRMAGSVSGATAIDAQRVAHAAVAVGIAAAALESALAHVTAAREAGDRIDRSQAIQWMLADIATETEAARAATREAASRVPSDPDESAAMARVLAAEAAVEGSRRALQVVGTAGVLTGSVVERLYRDAKVMELIGGSSEDQLREIADRLLPEIV